MVRHTPLYDEIVVLCQDLIDTKITKRRRAGDKLIQLLGDEKNRRKLTREAIPCCENNDAAAQDLDEHMKEGTTPIQIIQRRAVAQVWRMILGRAIRSVELSQNGKNKLDVMDIIRPCKLLEICDIADDDLFDGQTMTKMSKVETKLLFRYCWNMLEETEDVYIEAEPIVLRMMYHMCTRPNYVAYFRPNRHGKTILDIIQPRLVYNNSTGTGDSGDGDGKSHHDDDTQRRYQQLYGRNQEYCSDIFGALFTTFHTLGFALYLIRSDALQWMAQWCCQNKDHPNVEQFSGLWIGTAILLQSSPDQAIAPLQRYGYDILHWAMTKLHATIPINNVLRTALLNYVQQHLIVCQVAGCQQGMMTGDLGDIGSASLTTKNIYCLLDCLFPCKSDDFDRGIPTKRYQTRLELLIRLLACAQRLYISQAEWDSMKDPVAEITIQLNKERTINDYNNTLDNFDDKHHFGFCSTTVLVGSPFVNRILRKLLSLVDPPVYALSGHTSSKVAQDNRKKHGASVRHEDLSNDEDRRYPLLAALSYASGNYVSNVDETISLLHIVSAACELFPLGNCWLSSTQKIWNSVTRAVESLSKSCARPLSVNVSSLSDLAVVVKVICNILEAHGKYNASPEIQKWVLVCLEKLSVATDAQLVCFEEGELEKSGLVEAWRQVWEMLFRPNLSYRDLTRSTQPGSNGDLVIRLLIQIIRFACVDPTSRILESSRHGSFLMKHQNELWNLPLFERPDGLYRSAFMLIYSVLYHAGLHDHGSDQIAYSVSKSESWILRMKQCGVGRRSKLLCLCLHFLEINSSLQWKEERTISIVVACVSILVNGSSDTIPTLVFYSTESKHPPNVACLPEDIAFTPTFASAEFRTCRDSDNESKTNAFSCLWAWPLSSPENMFPEVYLYTFDFVGQLLQYVQEQTRTKQPTQQCLHFISLPYATNLFRVAETSLTTILSSCMETNPIDELKTKHAEDGHGMGRLTQPLLLSTTSTFLRIYLTLIFSSRSEFILSSFDRTASYISELFLTTVAQNTVFNLVDEERKVLFADLIRIVRATLHIRATGMSKSLLRDASKLYRFCKNILTVYRVGDVSNERKTATVHATADDDNDTLFVDEESDDDNLRNNRRKRKHATSVNVSKQKRHHAIDSKIQLNRISAYLVGCLLISLNPSSKDCNLVVRALLGVDSLEDDAYTDSEYPEYDVDILGAIHSVEFFCTESVLIGRRIHYEEKNLMNECPHDDAKSVPLLICKIIRAVRFFAAPHSAYHLFGYKSCAKILQFFDQNRHVVSLSSNEAGNVVELIHTSDISQDRHSLILRPELRIRRMDAAISAYQTTLTSVHAKLDKDFGKDFVITSLLDINSHVRRQGRIAVAAALVVLEEEKIISTVTKLLPPISNSKPQYRKWYLDRICSNDISSPAVEQAWNDARLPLQMDYLNWWVILGKYSSNPEILHEVLFKLVKLATSSPELQGLCFQMVEQVAILKGYTKTDIIFDTVIRYMTRLWLNTDWSLLDFPLMISAPSTFRRLLQSHQLVFMSESSKQVCGELSSKAFVRRHGHQFLPQIFVRIVSGVIHTASTLDGHRVLLDDATLKQFCGIFDHRYNDDVARKVVESHLPSILAESLALQCQNEDDTLISAGMTQIINELLSSDHQKRLLCNISGDVIRRCFVLIGESSESDMRSKFFNALRSFVKSRSEVRAGDIFAQGGCSIIELLVLSRFRLVTSFSKSEMILRWQSLAMLVKFLKEKNRQSDGWSSQMSYLMHTLLSIVSNPKLSPVQLLAIRSLKEIVKDISAGNKKSLIASRLSCTFATILELHRNAQNNFIKTCRDCQFRYDKLRRESSDLLAHKRKEPTESSDLTALLKHRSFVTKDDTSLLLESFDLLRVLVENANTACWSPSVVHSFSVEEGADPLLFALTSLDQLGPIRPFITNIEKESEENIYSDLDGLLDMIILSPSTSQTFVCSQLADVEHWLRWHRTEKERSLSYSQLQRLYHLSLKYSSTHEPNAIKVAISRCFGEISVDLSSLHHTFDILELIRPQGTETPIIGTEKLLQEIQTRAVLCLVEVLHGTDAKCAMVAIDTLKAVLSLRGGRGDFCNSVDELKASAILISLRSCAHSNPHQYSKLELEGEEILAIRGEYSDSLDWCWAQHLWQCDDETSFHSWICHLVVAILACNSFPKHDSSKIRGNFWQKCQRMCTLDASLSRTIFPALILHLIQSSDACSPISNQNTLLADVWLGSPNDEMNIRLSKGFDFLLRNLTAKQNIQYVDLVVETLDTIRRTTQHRFMNSPNHVKNRMGKFDDPDIPWMGVPYGVVLKLDGILVANAFIQARRFEGALFYAEMYADCRFMRSTAFADVLSIGSIERIRLLEASSTKFISGFNRSFEKSGDQQETIKNDITDFITLLRTCFVNLGENDCQKAIDRKAAEIAFFASKCPLSVASFSERDPASLDKLQRLDNVSFCDRQSTSSMISVADCLGELGCLNSLDLYLTGLKMLDKDNLFSDWENSAIRDSWFECRLHAMQWEDDIYVNDISALTSNENPIASEHPSVDLSYLEKHSESLFFDGEAGFYEYTVQALSALKSDDLKECNMHVLKARLRCIEECSTSQARHAASAAFVTTASRLRILNDLDDLVSGSLCDSGGLSHFTPSSSSGRLLLDEDVDTLSLCVREIMLRILLRKAAGTSHTEINKSLQSNLIRQFETSLKSDCFNLADGALKRLYGIVQRKSNPDRDQNDSLFHLRLREAALLEKKGAFMDAIRVAKLAARNQHNIVVKTSSICADALHLCGKWTAAHKTEPVKAILNKYLLPAVANSQSIYDQLPNGANGKRLTEAHILQSELALNLLDTLSARMNSNEWKSNVEMLTGRQLKLEELEKKLVVSKRLFEKLNLREQSNPSNFVTNEYNALRKEISPLRRELLFLQSEHDELMKSLEEYREMTIRSIVSALTVAGVESTTDLAKHMYCLVSLWFSIEEDVQWTRVDSIIEHAILCIPTFRYIPLVTQLFARIETSSSETKCSQSRLLQLVQRMSHDHPYHCIPHLITQSRSVHDETNSKANAATEILNKLQKEDPGFIGELIESYRKLYEAYFHLVAVDANRFGKEKWNKKISLNEVCKTTAVHLDRCLGSGSRKTKFPPCVLTKPPLLRAGCDYGDATGISDPIGSERVSGFENYFTILATGVSKPKTVVCKGSQGGHYKQLVKGSDDTRQDAIMEQIFAYVNSLMVREKCSDRIKSERKRKVLLRLATYAVIPLSDDAGVLEWVGNSEPFREFFIDKPSSLGGNSRYYPENLAIGQCKNFLDEVKLEPIDRKREVFDAICRKRAPVFRYFFVERFGDCLENWYASKLRYTRSVAVSSMVGHILGIGDRHLSNMLVDHKTGEVIHIDFGIVFEKGKSLSFPELVPFRMTMNIVDGMGPLGTEGTFTSAAVTTLSTLRENTDALLTILSAIVSDPFYKWNVLNSRSKEIDEAKQSLSNNDGLYGYERKRNDVEEQVNRNVNECDEKAHAMRRIHDKLLGYEDGTAAEQQSVESQVMLLVNASQDPDNLCRMFPGWMPFV